MTHRLLPASDWDQLVGTELEAAIDVLDPARTSVLVVEDSAGNLIGCWAFLSVLHAEGVWIAPTHRGRSSVLRHLLRGMREVATASGAATVWTASADPQVSELLTHFGAQEVPVTSFVMPVKES